ncbi:hypothetical protein TGPRC2_212280 [Toxoplasma gondii TgCatPRC2]|uniref:Transmembrane protein n=3 Tax=Toxoplasma gondii TaxID=5811 RepID=A0A151HQH0_TOXGO|nr:hypothetical protein TGME49_212280 [Toxoplasma gondii ME49]EPT26844.1 hypothetical protein TGME49_212280 [Toxoplasma gondii ME49]KFG45892.1 hypothetical protein TGDOM2_212280 [Toxoplasma gondii GAB2-2007-GAL-DOM2]KYK71635.1 hypothetical protein TGPRC2_212280 [Toxoplasma gondii TgCatPRC2]|eukprot:XP_002371829.2 hypothetical protein TGME49_212280 [Toxoplasma gondii ME49]
MPRYCQQQIVCLVCPLCLEFLTTADSMVLVLYTTRHSFAGKFLENSPPHTTMLAALRWAHKGPRNAAGKNPKPALTREDPISYGREPLQAADEAKKYVEAGLLFIVAVSHQPVVRQPKRKRHDQTYGHNLFTPTKESCCAYACSISSTGLCAERYVRAKGDSVATGKDGPNRREAGPTRNYAEGLAILACCLYLLWISSDDNGVLWSRNKSSVASEGEQFFPTGAAANCS